MCLKRIHFNPAQISANLTKLESDFIAKGGKWEKYKVEELFYINTPKKKFNANTLKFDGKYPYVARGEKNNGIRGYIDEDVAYLNEANTISFGQDTATMFYQPKAYFTGDKIKIFSPKNFILNQYIANFLITILKRAFSNFSWGSSSYEVSVLKNIDIKLPKINDKIAFDFMESFIKELELERVAEMEAERIKELEAYLKATGLNNYN